MILPPDLLERIERQVVGVGRHVSWLRANGQHLKRGVLLHGPPGTGKTHTVRYLLGQMPGVTVVVLTGAALGCIAAACSVARALQPAMVVVEDVDLIAEQRDSRAGQHPLLFQLLNEMDGLARTPTCLSPPLPSALAGSITRPSCPSRTRTRGAG